MPTEINKQPAKILIVEDELTEATVFKEYLNRAGYKAVIAPDGERALEMIEKERPDLILLDVFLPKLDGIEVLKRLELNPSFSKIPVIVVTNLTDSETASRILSIRNTDYLVKSENIIEEILKRVQERLRGENPLGENSQTD